MEYPIDYLNKCINADCLEAMKSIPDKSIDMILCDLPYWTTACKWDTIIPFEPLWEQYKRIIKDNGAIVLTASQPFTSALVMSNPKMFKYALVWNKMIGGAFVLAKKRILPSHEDILIFGKKQTTYNAQMTDKDISKIRPNNKGSSSGIAIPVSGGMAINNKDRDNTKSYPTSVINLSSKMAECNAIHRVHPTQKPVALFEYLIKTYTNEWETVLDNCAGSGTTGIACKNTKRNYILIEQDEEYCNIIRNRLAPS